jgi:hypothetical protein
MVEEERVDVEVNRQDAKSAKEEGQAAQESRDVYGYLVTTRLFSP